MLTIAEVNGMNFEVFIETFGNAVEHCALAAGAVWSQTPFSSLHHLHACFCQFLDDLTEDAKKSVLRVHPDLAGGAAQRGALTSESAREQSGAGLSSLTADEARQLSRNNHTYKNKFGFPFVICARQNRKASILAGIAERVQNAPDAELRTGLAEVKKIVLLRLQNIVQDESKL